MVTEQGNIDLERMVKTVFTFINLYDTISKRGLRDEISFIPC